MLEIDPKITLKPHREDADRTLYSLRHGSIMFRLMFGSSIDTVTLARNARTSPEMIDRFYATPLQGEMNIDKLQGKRNPRSWEQSGKPARPLDTDALDEQPADLAPGIRTAPTRANGHLGHWGRGLLCALYGWRP